MSPKETLGNAGLRTRVAELEAQLGAVVRTDKAHEDIEAKLRAALAYLESIVDTVREPLLVLDGARRVKKASRAFYQTFGVSHEDTEGQFLYDLGNREWNIPALRTLLDEVLQQEIRDFEVVHEFPSLGRRVMLLNARKLWSEGNHTELVLLAIEDITERKGIEDELVRSNQELQRFAYVAAHDLRSPLNAALRLSQLVARNLEGKEERELLALAIESMERLSTLMGDILTYSEISIAPQQRALVPLEEALHIVLANLQHQIEKTGADINVGSLPKSSADRTQMVLVFQNLISNALKYRREETPLRIGIDVVREGRHWRVSVNDNGQGFEAQYAVIIFEPFKRLHGQNVPGSGIGLATCKRIIERLGGRIWADSIPGEGSTFYFTLPVEQAEA